MSNPLISVVIPVYNTAPYLEKCLDSVVKQTYQNLQVIIINDGSTDDSAEICQKFADKDKRIEFINKKNEGVSTARNMGIEKSHGEWIYFLDSDDYLDFNAFSQLVSISLEYKVDVIQFGLQSVKDGALVKKHCPSTFKIYSNLAEFIKENEMKPLSACLHFTKNSLIKEHGVFFNPNLKHNEDMLFMYTIFCYANKIVTFDKILYNQVLSPNSASRKPVEIKVLYDKLTFLEELCTQVKNENLIKEYKEEINNLAKGIFVIPTQMKDFSEYKKHKYDIQKKYRNLIHQNQKIFYKPFLKIGGINLDIVVNYIKVNHLIRRIS